ncbi:5-oxoprolinase subunit PxpA [Ureibacillus thermosphaericus]|uniref:5-oxoprolinase subunit PxpA n=1 Tax=Ureibacillus thermosphaericus TaxID=51173 RepID=UPI000BBBC311|nr:5-oxoprolinase subunit PxpA [Ureibacillus thermosphaericus]
MDINCDLGEGFGNYKMPNDEKILPYVTSINVACGFHAGDPIIMEDTVNLAIKYNVKIGAHPGYPDLQGFGRRELNMSPREIYTMLLYQLGALNAIVNANGAELHHVKPHGALYNQSANDEIIADAVISAVKDFNSNLILYCLSGSLMAEMAERQGIEVYHEVFADRNYNDDGTLVHRKHPNALIKDNSQMLKHVERIMRSKKILTINNKFIDIQADTICIHGDGENALQFAQNIANIK